jgi:hypothetical protein
VARHLVRMVRFRSRSFRPGDRRAAITAETSAPAALICGNFAILSWSFEYAPVPK